MTVFRECDSPLGGLKVIRKACRSMRRCDIHGGGVKVAEEVTTDLFTDLHSLTNKPYFLALIKYVILISTSDRHIKFLRKFKVAVSFLSRDHANVMLKRYHTF